MTAMQEFKEFAVKGNVVDLAVGVIIGGGFGKIVDSVVGDLVMPVVGAILGKPDFSGLFLPLASPPAGTVITLDALRKAGVPVLAYGNFLTIALNFLLLSLTTCGTGCGAASRALRRLICFTMTNITSASSRKLSAIVKKFP